MLIRLIFVNKYQSYVRYESYNITMKKKIFLLSLIILFSSSYYIFSSPYRMHRIDRFLNYEQQDILQVRGKIVTDDNVTVTYTELVYHLSFLGGVYNQEEFTNILYAINRIKSIDINSAIQHYSRSTEKEYKIVLHGLNDPMVKKIKVVLEKQHLSKKYAFKLSGERRVYPYGDFLTPVLGYNKKKIDTATNFTYLEGVTGVEKEYNTLLADTPLVRATDLHLSIDFQRQRSLEKELIELKALYDAKEVISVVLDDTFHIKAFASSNRYVPNDIHRKDFSNLDIHALQYLFRLDEFGSLVGDTLYLNAKNPKYQIYADLELNQPSGIDLPYERVYNNENRDFKNYKVNFIQLVKAYSPFYLDGYIGNPKVAKIQSTDQKQIISQELAQSLKKKADMFFGAMPGKRVTLEFKDKNISADIYIKGFTQNNHKYIQAYFTIYYKEEIPFDVVVKSESSASNQYLEATIYSKKDNHKIGTVIQSINKYQANRRNGSEREIVGIYRANDGNYYIDTITTKGTLTASCNAEQTYKVETFEVTQNGLISKGLRSFDIDLI